MEPSQQQQRRAAAKEFQEALEQLEDILQENLSQEQEQPKLHNDHVNQVKKTQDSTAIDLEAFEDAAADIEQYFSDK